MTARTRVTVSAATSGRWLSTRETVWVETPAARATSRMVTRRPGVVALAAPSDDDADLTAADGRSTLFLTRCYR
jgi:hypothetical protein